MFSSPALAVVLGGDFQPRLAAPQQMGGAGEPAIGAGDDGVLPDAGLRADVHTPIRPNIDRQPGLPGRIEKDSGLPHAQTAAALLIAEDGEQVGCDTAALIQVAVWHLRAQVRGSVEPIPKPLIVIFRIFIHAHTHG